MASKSRSRKSGTSAAPTRKTKKATPVDGVLTSLEPVTSAAVSDELPAHAVVETAPVVKAPRRNTRKKPVADAGSVAEAPVPKPPRKRSRKSASASDADSAPPAAGSAESPSTDSFADAFASAFLYAPDLESASAPEAPSPSPEPVATPEPAVERVADVAPPAIPEDDESDERPIELPFIIDIPREVPVVDRAPSDEWLDQVLEPAPQTPQGDDQWVDQVLVSPAKSAASARPPRARAQAARVPAARPSAPRPAVKVATKAPSKAAAPVATPATAAGPQAAVLTGTRWWMVLPVFLVAAALLFANRPSKAHAPVPADLLGTWTTSFWLYEHQTLEIKRDTVVATLDEPDEGRYPITKVETSDAGRETAVKITYRNTNGDEKVLDFLADKSPATALRFRAHTGLVWVRAE